MSRTPKRRELINRYTYGFCDTCMEKRFLSGLSGCLRGSRVHSGSGAVVPPSAAPRADARSLWESGYKGLGTGSRGQRAVRACTSRRCSSRRSSRSARCVTRRFGSLSFVSSSSEDLVAVPQRIAPPDPSPPRVRHLERRGVTSRPRGRHSARRSVSTARALARGRDCKMQIQRREQIDKKITADDESLKSR